MEQSAHKLELLRRIAELEKQELWHLDVEDDPETYPLMADQVDYLNEKLSSRIKNKIANIAGSRFFDRMIANRQLIIKEVRGIENFTAVKGGCLVTCNHFSVCDNYAVWVCKLNQAACNSCRLTLAEQTFNLCSLFTIKEEIFRIDGNA